MREQRTLLFSTQLVTLLVLLVCIIGAGYSTTQVSSSYSHDTGETAGLEPMSQRSYTVLDTLTFDNITIVKVEYQANVTKIVATLYLPSVVKSGLNLSVVLLGEESYGDLPLVISKRGVPTLSIRYKERLANDFSIENLYDQSLRLIYDSELLLDHLGILYSRDRIFVGYGREGLVSLLAAAASRGLNGAVMLMAGPYSEETIISLIKRSGLKSILALLDEVNGLGGVGRGVLLVSSTDNILFETGLINLIVSKLEGQAIDTIFVVGDAYQLDRRVLGSIASWIVERGSLPAPPAIESIDTSGGLMYARILTVSPGSSELRVYYKTNLPWIYWSSVEGVKIKEGVWNAYIPLSYAPTLVFLTSRVEDKILSSPVYEIKGDVISMLPSALLLLCLLTLIVVYRRDLTPLVVSVLLVSFTPLVFDESLTVWLTAWEVLELYTPTAIPRELSLGLVAALILSLLIPLLLAVKLGSGLMISSSLVSTPAILLYFIAVQKLGSLLPGPGVIGPLLAILVSLLYYSR